MNENEKFESMAERFNTRFGYLPAGKDALYAVDFHHVLSDLTVLFNELEDLKKAAAHPATNESPTIKCKCSWCGKPGATVEKVFHNECYEGLLNGDGII